MGDNSGRLIGRWLGRLLRHSSCKSGTLTAVTSSLSSTNLPNVPAEVRAELEQLIATLRQDLDTKLISALVHGSALHGTYVVGASDLDVVLVIDSDDHRDLLRLAAPCRLARFRAAIEVMILHPRELAHALDVFPLLFGDVARHHLMLAGINPFADLQVPPEHVRLRIEQELRDADIRLRRVFVDLADDPAALARELARKLKQLRSPLAALLRLRGQPHLSLHDPELYGKVGLHYKVEVGSLQESARDPVLTYQQFAQLLRVSAADINHSEGSR